MTSYEALGRFRMIDMRHDDTLSHFIDRVYAAALDPAAWPDVLAASAAYVGAQCAGLLTKDPGAALCIVHDHAGFEFRYVHLYRDEYWPIDPFAVSAIFPMDGVTTFEDYMPLSEIREGRFYQEWLHPQGWIDAASVVLERSTTSFSTFVVARHETRGLVDEMMVERMELIAPHIRRAMRIGKAIDRGQSERAVFADVLDGLSAGVFLVDEGARIIHANHAGRTLLAAGEFFSSMRSRLVARERDIDRALRQALATIAAGDDDIGDGAISLPLISSENEHHVAHVLPLTSAVASRAGVGGHAIAAVFVHKATLDHVSLPETVARHYQLTPTELRVLLGIVEVGGAPEVADLLGITDNTVKTHLGRVYQKTGTRRQADLVKLVAAFATPLHG